MPTPKFFMAEFDALAINDTLGHPLGELAYAYLRVSSSGQAEEGRSGLPRQLLHIHEAAIQHRLKIPRDFIFADDDSGFEFNDRPDLTRLRQECRSDHRRANAVVIEHLDRLSRNADWHQGYLLDEMKQFGIHTIFWKQFSSRIERVVMGAVAQDGMEQAKLRMAQGTLHKARDGRVTAKTPAYGYKLVDSSGNEGSTAKRDTHYGIREDEAQVVRYIYQKVLEGYPLRRIAMMLEGNYPAPGKFSHWEPKMIALIIKKEVYKGEFIAHRNVEERIAKQSNRASLTELGDRYVTRRIQRPREEWIIVPVPAIVLPEDWEKANEIVSWNLTRGRREASSPFLLTGLITCATCGYRYVGRLRKETKGKKQIEYTLTNYRCSSRGNRVGIVSKTIGCNQKQISMRILDQAVWSLIYEVLLDPGIMIGALEREFKSEKNEQVRNQIDFLKGQARELRGEDEKLYVAYLANAFDEMEYAENRSLITDQLQNIQSEIGRLEEQLMTPEQLEEKKQEILAICQSAQNSGLVLDAPFEIRQRIIQTIVDRIVLNANEGWFEMEGVISGQYLFNNNDGTDEGGGGQVKGGNGRGRITHKIPSRSASHQAYRGRVHLHVKSSINTKGKSPFQFLTI